MSEFVSEKTNEKDQFHEQARLELAVLLKQASRMMISGVSLVQVMRIFIEQTGEKSVRNFLKELVEFVTKGVTLPQALQNCSFEIPEYAILAVSETIQYGRLPYALEQIAKQMEHEEKMRISVKKSVFYPRLIALICVGVFFSMLVVVFPHFIGMFSGLQFEMPVFTSFIIELSDFFRMFWWVVAAIFLLLGGIYRLLRLSASGKRVHESLVNLHPFLGRLMRECANAQFTRTFATLLSCRVAPVNALPAAIARIKKCELLKDSLNLAYEEVVAGKSLSKAFLERGELPKMLTQMTGIGEEIGNLDEMMAQLADYYEERAEKIQEKRTRILEPVYVLMMVIFVMILVVALLQPMIILYDTIGGM